MPPRRTPNTDEELAASAWRLLFDFFISTRGEREAVLKTYDLTPNDSRGLFSLDRREGRTMRSLADEWGCDASNATWIVDRLEKKGLAVRTSSATDRRVRLVLLTAAGARTRGSLLRAMHRPPPELVALDDQTLRRLAEALAALPIPRVRKE
jgi:DNA-binding MarR family transcriptional regulator